MFKNWPLIVELAKAEGVTPEALKKWRQRKSVPHRWRLPLIDAARTKGRRLTARDFNEAA